MNDIDIVKVGECIRGEKVLCLSCPYRDRYPDCRKYVIRDIFDVAKRQKAEIERLEDLNKCYYTSCQQIAKSNHEIKAEAVKEFAERLKEDIMTLCCRKDYKEFLVTIHIDNLVKEMVGAESG